MSNETVTLAVLDDGDGTTWSMDAIIIEVPKEDFDADVFDNGKECSKYFDKGVSAKAAASCIDDILETLYPGGKDDGRGWDADTIVFLARKLRHHGFGPKGE